MAETVKIEGLKELDRALKELPLKIQGNILRGAVRAGAQVIRKDAMARAPVDKGKLKRNIRIQRSRKSTNTSEKATVGVRARGKKDDPSNAYYWKFVELGTSKMAAHPFLRPAFEAMKMKAVEAIRTYLGSRIESEAAKLGKRR